MSSFWEFMRNYPILKIGNLFFYPLLVYIAIGLIYSSLFTAFYSLIYWVCSVLLVLAYLDFEYNRLFIILDTKNRQKIYLDITEQPAINNNSFSKEYKKWLIDNADLEQIDLFYKPLDFNSGGECCMCCCTSIILFLFLTSFFVIYIQGESALTSAILIFLLLMIFYPILRIRSERKMHKLLDSEIKRILYEEETGYSPFRDGKFTSKYRAWLIQQARGQSRLETSY